MSVDFIVALHFSKFCLVYWEEGLGCGLIESTLGPGNPGGGVRSLGGGEDTRMQRGQGDSLRAT